MINGYVLQDGSNKCSFIKFNEGTYVVFFYDFAGLLTVT